MTTKNTQQNALADFKVSLKLKLTTLWASSMFLCIYVDYFHLYMPNNIENIQTGRAFELDIIQGFLLAALASLTIPALMIFLSISDLITQNIVFSLINSIDLMLNSNLTQIILELGERYNAYQS